MSKQTAVKPADMKTTQREQRGKDIFIVPLSRITVQEDFNKRADDNYGDVEELANTIEAVGQIVPAYGHKGKDGNWVLTAGHRRYAALHAIAERTGVEQTMAIMKTGENDNKTRLTIQYIENVKHPNTDWDRAMIVKGLLGEGLKVKEIAERLGVAQPVISKLKGLLDTAPEVQAALASGSISGTTVSKMTSALKDKGEKLAAAVKESVEAAKAEGKTKATDRHSKVAGTRTPQTIMKQFKVKLEAKEELTPNEAFTLALFSKVLEKCSDQALQYLIRNGVK